MKWRGREQVDMTNLKTMNLTLRAGKPDDARRCGEICFVAFATISNHHNFPLDIPTPETAIGLMTRLLSRPDVYSVVAEVDGKIVGSNFLWEGDPIAAIGPITIDPTSQNAGVGRQLMQDVMKRAKQKDFAGVRLVQTTFHNRSLALYAKLGFEVREPMATLHGALPGRSFNGFPVRLATDGDVESCCQLCRKVHGYDRKNELLGAIQQKTATLVERKGRVTAYATIIGFFGHAVAESNDDLKALIAAAPEIAGPGILVPTRNSDIFRWCLNEGLRMVQPMTLMSLGSYNEPHGAYLPSILY